MTYTLPAQNNANCWSEPETSLFARQIWANATRGVVDRRSVWHTPTLATRGLTDEPELRTVVLRAASSETWTFRFHTDRRSKKLQHILRYPQIAMHVYDVRHKLQVRMAATASLHTDDAVANSAWTATQPMSRVGYAQRIAPGSVLSGERLERLSVGVHDVAARDNFAAVVAQVSAIDWLLLAAEGHQRAHLWRSQHGVITGQWVAP